MAKPKNIKILVPNTGSSRRAFFEENGDASQWRPPSKVFRDRRREASRKHARKNLRMEDWD